MKKDLVVDVNERKIIKEATKQQSCSQEWLVVRKSRIAASKCKREIQRPAVTPEAPILLISIKTQS